MKTKLPIAAPATDDNKAKIWVAVIGALGVVIAAGIAAFHTTPDINLSGVVRQTKGGAITGARVTLVPDSGPSIVRITDSSGTFATPLSAKFHSVRLTVDAAGFRSEIRQFDPHQAGSADIELESMQQPDQPPAAATIRTGDIRNTGTTVVGNGNTVNQPAAPRHRAAPAPQ